mmetsp:Transcript_10279/g.30398  ORF Transcript_10279/g.30398 Transcript_10279/m.30398 type:complete len:226 (-) Transcript_10279:745-1422(-)
MGSALASVAGRCMASPPWRRESRASPRRKRGGSSSSSGSTRSKRSSRPSSWRASDDHPWPGQADREGGRGRGDSASGAGHHGGSFRHDGDLLLVHHYPLQDGLDQAVMRPGSAAPHGHHPSPVPAARAGRGREARHQESPPRATQGLSEGQHKHLGGGGEQQRGGQRLAERLGGVETGDCIIGDSAVDPPGHNIYIRHRCWCEPGAAQAARAAADARAARPAHLL